MGLFSGLKKAVSNTFKAVTSPIQQIGHVVEKEIVRPVVSPIGNFAEKNAAEILAIAATAATLNPAAGAAVYGSVKMSEAAHDNAKVQESLAQAQQHAIEVQTAAVQQQIAAGSPQMTTQSAGAGTAAGAAAMPLDSSKMLLWGGGGLAVALLLVVAFRGK